MGQNEIEHHFRTSKLGLGLGKKPVLKEMLIIADYNSDKKKSKCTKKLHVIFLILVPGSARVSMVMYIILVRGRSRGRFEREATPLPGALWGAGTYTPHPFYKILYLLLPLGF